MQYTRFGNTGIEVSRLCLGCMDFTERLDAKEAQRLLYDALDRGINFLDTADAYGKGHSEEVLGEILQGRREEVILATKFWVKMADRRNAGGCSRVHIMQALEASLRRLRTDYVDLYQLHHPDASTPVEEVLSTLDALVKQGKVRYIGVSNHYAWQIVHLLGVAALHNWEPPVSLQCRYNLLDRAVENESLPCCRRFNLATMIYSPLDGGFLTGKYRRGEEPPPGSRFSADYLRRRLTEQRFAALDRLRAIAREAGLPLPQLAGAWLLSKPGVTTIILGGGTPEHFEAMYPCADLKLAPEVVAALDEATQEFRYQPFWNQPIVEGPPLSLHRL